MLCVVVQRQNFRDALLRNQQVCIANPNSSENASNGPPRGELRESPNDDHRVSDVSFEDFVYCFVWVSSKTLKGFHVLDSTVLS